MATVALNTVRVLGAGLKAAGLPAQASIGDGLGVAATVVVMVALIPPLGLVGAALAALISYLASMLYLIWIAYRHLHISPAALLLPTRADLSWLRATGWRFLSRLVPVAA